MSEKFEYCGHTIEVTPRRLSSKMWTWHYTIDDRNFKENMGEFAPDSWTAVTEGRDHARGVINRMTKCL